MGLSHSSSYHSSHVRSVTEYGPVILEPHSEIYPRLPICEFMGYDNKSYSPQFELFVQSYQALYDRPCDDTRSYYQVVALHALPFKAYDGVTGGVHEYRNETDWIKGRYGGYCHHGDVLFQPWHRPYLLLIESLLINEAKRIALQYPDNEREKYVEAANKLRHPYWDWAAEEAIKGIPDAFTEVEFEINTPKGIEKVRNPLKSYILPVDLSYPLEKGRNPTDKPHYKIPGLDRNPFTPAGYPTIRYPSPNYEDQYHLLNLNMTIYNPTVFRPGYYQTFHIDNYLHFSNNALRSNGKELGELLTAHPIPKLIGYSHFASIETTHDAFHFVAGGPGGHMSYADITAYDPLFFFHHVFVDRIFALWQAIFPDSWVPENISVNGTHTLEKYSVINEHTDLTPFRKSKTKFWTASDIRYIEKLGYTYPELMKFKGQDRKKLQAYVLAYYKPDRLYGRRFFAKLTIEECKLVGSYVIKVFVDLKNATAETPITSPHFAGLVAVRRKPRGGATYFVGSVDITAAMDRLGIRTQSHDYFYDVDPKTGLLNPKAIFDVKNDINIVACYLNGTGISPKEAGVEKVEVYSLQHDDVDPNFLVENS
ncbi:25216_t:CDS:2, partial [Racocetra persica]